jgi:hypothetical protein
MENVNPGARETEKLEENRLAMKKRMLLLFPTAGSILYFDYCLNRSPKGAEIQV